MTGWLQRSGGPAPDARVVGLPRAGGSARDFDGWAAALGPDVEMCAVQPPGRLDRFGEPPLRSVGALAEGVVDALLGLGDRAPAVLLGDCLGALVAFEAARLLAGRPDAPAHRVVAASYPAPDVLRVRRPYHAAGDDELRERLREVGGVPDHVLAEEELLALVLPAIRADFEAFETYVFHPGAPLEVDLDVIVGATDPWADPAGLRAWARHTESHFTLTDFPGGHFFLRDSAGIATWLRERALAMV